MPMRTVQTMGGPDENARALLMPKEGVMITVPIRGVIDDEPERGCNVEVLVGISHDEPPVLVLDEIVLRRRPSGPPLTTTIARASCKVPELLDAAIEGLAV